MNYGKTLFGRYINLLGIKQQEPSPGALTEITKAHLTRVPFENISKLLYKKQGMRDIPDLPQYLDGIEKFNFGGTCYSNNYYLYLLLDYLGYDVKLCGADMNDPDVHIVSMVKIEEHEFIVDVGYAAPFLQPLPREFNVNYSINFGDEEYILYPQDEAGHSKLEQYYKGELKHGYKAKPQPRKINFFKKVIEDSYRDDSTFMNALMFARFFENGSVILRNLSLIKTDKEKVTTEKINRGDVSSIIEDEFGVPKSITEESIAELGEFKDTWN